MESEEPVKETSLLDRLRNMWEFSNLMQYIFIFGKVVKIDDDFTIEVNAPSSIPTTLPETLSCQDYWSGIPIMELS